MADSLWGSDGAAMSKSARASMVAASWLPQSSASSAAASFTETVRGVKT